MNKVKFFAKLIALLAAAVLILLYLNSAYTKGFYYNDIYGEVQKFKEEIPNDIEICNFGSSHGLASFRFEEFDGDFNAFNFAMSGEDLYHNFAKLKQYSSHLKKGCVVFLPVSYFTFCTNTDEPSDKRYYMFLDKEYIKGYSIETYLNVRYFPVLRSGDGILKDLVNEEQMASIFYGDKNESASGTPTADVGSVTDLGIVTLSTSAGAGAANTLNPEELYKSDYVPSDAELYDFSELRSKSWHSEFKINNIYMDKNVDILVEMVEYCQDHGFVPILVSTPINHVLNDMFTDEELETFFYSNIAKVTEKTGVPYYDYSHDPQFSDNNGYFANGDHMNAVGGKAFTMEIMKLVEGK